MTTRRIISHRTCFLMGIYLFWLCAAGVGYAHADDKFLANSAGSAPVSSNNSADVVSDSVANKLANHGNLVNSGGISAETRENQPGSDAGINDTVDRAGNANSASGTAKGSHANNPGAVKDIENQPVGNRVLNGGRVGIGRAGKKKGGRGSNNGGYGTPGVPSVWQVILALSVVLVLIVAVSYIFRRYLVGMRQGSGGGVIEILAHSALTPKQSLSLVKLGDRILLLGISPGHIARLDVIDNPDEVAIILGRIEENSAQSISGTFKKLFHRESLNYELDDDALFDTLDANDDVYSDVDDDITGGLGRDDRVHNDGRNNGKLVGGMGDEQLSEREKLLRDSSGELNGLLNKVKAMTRMGFRGR